MLSNKCTRLLVLFVLTAILLPIVASARFISVDPKASKYPSVSPYAYTLNNPLKYVDADGRETQIYSLPIGSNGINTGDKHLFIRVKNDNLGLNTSRGFYPENRAAAIANSISPFINIESGNEVVVKSDLSSELGEVMKLEAGNSSNATLEAIIAPPEGATTDQFDQAVLSAVDNLATQGTDYNIGGPNSNTMVDRTIKAAGGKIPTIKGATGQNYKERTRPEERIGMPPREYE